MKNTYLLENIDDLVDKILEKRQHIDYVRKDIVNQRKRQLTYLAQLFELYKSRDAEIERLQLSVLMSLKEKEYLEHRRNEAFNALLDLMVERRRVLGLVQDHTMGMQYHHGVKVRASQTRLEAHALAEETMKIWSTKLGRSSLMGASAIEDGLRVQQMAKELEIKQKQLLKLVQGRELTEAKRRLAHSKYEVQGKLGESLELLVLLVKEAKEDMCEMKDKLKETYMELEEIDRKTRYQEHLL